VAYILRIRTSIWIVQEDRAGRASGEGESIDNANPVHAAAAS